MRLHLRPKWIVLGLCFSILILSGIIPSNAQSSERIIYLPVVNRSLDVTWRWETPVVARFDPDPYALRTFQLAIDGEGHKHIFYEPVSSPDFVYTSVFENGAWSPSSPVAESLGTSTVVFPPIRGLQRDMHFIWHTDLGYGTENRYRLLYTHFNGEFWSAPEEIHQSDHNIAARPQIDGSGRAYALIEDVYIFRDFFQAVRRDTGWETLSEIPRNYTPIWARPDMLGGVHLYSAELYNDNFYHSYWQNGQFLVEEWVSLFRTSGKTVELDSANNLHVFRRSQVPVPGGIVYGLYHQCLQNSRIWQEETVISGEYNMGDYLIANDWSGRLAAAWMQEDRLWVSLFEGCESVTQTSVLLPSNFPLELHAIALSRSPDQFCAFLRKPFSSDYSLACARISD